MSAGPEDVIVVGRGPNRGIWCRTQAAYGLKSPSAIEDLQKARWYVEREIARLTAEKEQGGGSAA